MKKFKVLILTDHSKHSNENSLYSFATTMLRHPLTCVLDVSSRGHSENKAFFNAEQEAELWASPVNEDFKFTPEGSYLKKELKKTDPSSYDLIWLRMPPPLSQKFLAFIQNKFEHQVVINHPKSIHETGSKEFLIQFPELCPPLKICSSIEDIISFKTKFPIVLKPFREYGGKGIIKINGAEVWSGNTKMSFEDFILEYKKNPIKYLAVKFLKNVSEGDKRIIVVNGKIMGASLRMPPKDSWICNVSMGGKSVISEVDKNEKNIISTINPILSKMGIVMYGVDTLVDDDGKRILSEINTTSIGGLPQIGNFKKLPLVEEAVDLIWEYFLKHKKNAWSQFEL